MPKEETCQGNKTEHFEWVWRTCHHPEWRQKKKKRQNLKKILLENLQKNIKKYEITVVIRNYYYF